MNAPLCIACRGEADHDVAECVQDLRDERAEEEAEMTSRNQDYEALYYLREAAEALRLAGIFAESDPQWAESIAAVAREVADLQGRPERRAQNA